MRGCAGVGAPPCAGAPHLPDRHRIRVPDGGRRGVDLEVDLRRDLDGDGRRRCAPDRLATAGATGSDERPDPLHAVPPRRRPAPGAWTLTAYYTAVESFHSGPAQAVTGCRPGADECSNGTDALGSHPTDFLDAVRRQGSGRITAGKYSGDYLMWDADSGYAVDTAVLDQSDRPLRPFVSAGAGDTAIAPGTAFQLLDCGVDVATGHAPDAAGCARLRSASWVVTGPTRQPADADVIELYVGEEDGPGFGATSPLLVHSRNARTTLG